VTGEDPVRSLLEQIAASAGDPPEHGLEGLAARRRRRARHRRGAVATAVALAVLVAAVGPWLSELSDHEDVTASDSGDLADGGAQLPDVLTLRCTPEGIDVPVASIRPRRDGLHVNVDNALGEPTQVWVRSDDWDSGTYQVPPGRSTWRQPVPPGVLAVGCRIGGHDQRRQVELVDVNDLYDEPELACDRDEQDVRQDLAVPQPSGSYTTAVRQVLADQMRADDSVLAYGAYPDERLGDVINDAVVRVVRDDHLVAFVHLQAATPDLDAATPSNRPLWDHVARVEACRSFLTVATTPTSASG
jgi:hypothetical protein